MPQSIPRGLTRDHVRLALADLDAGADHPFGDPTRYAVVHGDNRYAPKAVVGLACRHLLGRVLLPAEFSGGEAPGQANFVLRNLGFTVVRKGEAVGDEPNAGTDWTDAEVALVVADYFAMLGQELKGEKYNKSDHRAALRKRLPARSDGSVEFKHANISGVMVHAGLPYIGGYKPRFNYQAALADAVAGYLAGHPGLMEGLADAPVVVPQDPAPPPADPDAAFEDPPAPVALPAPGKPWLDRRPRPKVDFVARDAANRRLGRLGEEFVVELERDRLRRLGHDDLARRVDWVSESVGDGLGFDVSSFDPDGGEQFIEVKTTGLGKYHPFLVTATEVRCSEDVPDRFRLYRVFDFGRGPRVYVLSGSLTATCRLEPVQFRAAAGHDET